MPEKAPRPESEFDSGLIQDVLGYNVVLDSEAPKDVYDERRELCRDAQRAVETMRTSMGSVAEAAGISVDPAEMAAWRPAGSEIHQLRRELTRERKMLGMIDGVDTFLRDQVEEARLAGVSLRPHQQRVMHSFYDFLVKAPRTTPEGGKGGIIEMPTGTGKTAIFANMAAALKYGETDSEPRRVLVLVPTQNILKQTMGEQGERGFGKFAPHLDLGAYYQDAKDLDREVVVMTTASFDNLMRQKKMQHFDAVIIDEVHMAIGKQTGANLAEYCADKLTVGLSATPEFSEERSAYKLLPHQIAKMELPEAIHAGYLAPVKATLHETKIKADPTDLPTERAARKRYLRALRRDARLEASIAIAKDAVERGLGVIIRCPAGNDIDYAVKLAEKLNDVLVRSEAGIMGGMRWIGARAVGGSAQRESRTMRQLTMEQFDEGNIEVLTYVSAINVGVDCRAKVFINADPTGSEVEEKQGMGRALRLMVGPPPERKPIRAELHDFADPELGDEQYTALKALNLENGGQVDHDPVEASIPIKRARKPEIRPVLEEVTTRVLGETALEHNDDVVLPGLDELEASIANRRGPQEVSVGEASQILGVSVVALKGIMLAVGTNPNNRIPLTELLPVLELYPELMTERLPTDGGYVLAHEMAAQMPVPVRTFSLLPLARVHGINPRRFIGPDNRVNFYFAQEDQAVLASLITQTRKSSKS